MKTTYRGFKIEVTRAKSVAGTALISGVAIDKDENTVLINKANKAYNDAGFWMFTAGAFIGLFLMESAFIYMEVFSK